MPRPLFTREKDLVPIVQEAGWSAMIEGTSVIISNSEEGNK